MSWETLAYTDAGIELLMDAVSGKRLTITQARATTYRTQRRAGPWSCWPART